jgi:hypothetical protein
MKTKTTTVAQSLFDPVAHQAIIEWLDSRIATLSLGVPLLSDENETDNKFNRRYAHNPPYLVGIHRQLTDFASDLFGEKLKPSYVFLSIYNEQGICPLHIDRPQCYRTIDYLIDQDVDEEWPLHVGPIMSNAEREQILESGKAHPSTKKDIAAIKKATEFEPVILSPNDAVCYSGTHSWHYRDQIKGRSARLAFFHFVQEDFDGPLD